MELESFELVLLRRPANAPAYDEATLERIQGEHLAYHASRRASGHIASNGPVMNQPDEPPSRTESGRVSAQLRANGSSPVREQLEDAAEVESLVDQRVSAEPEDEGQPGHEPALDDCGSPCTSRVEPEKDEEGCDARLVGADAAGDQAHRSADACQREDERRLPPPDPPRFETLQHQPEGGHGDDNASGVEHREREGVRAMQQRGGLLLQLVDRREES